MKPVAGFRDVFGVDLRRRRYLGQVFGSVAESFGFEPLEVPVVEQAAAYSEEVVGLSPWPEWNVRGVFSLDIPNYNRDYEDSIPSSPAVLIPEGTLSVTRWLGDRLSQLPDPRRSPDLPLKIYYEVGCYRNELLNTLSATKGRQFTQFGVEVLGSSSIAADLEVMSISAEALRALGVSDSAITFRISSNRLYSDLARASGFSHAESIALKELFDTIGECKAGKRSDRLPAARTEVLNELARKAVPEALVALWTYIVERAPSPINATDYSVFGAAYERDVSYLDTICRTMGGGSLAVDVDFCVVRSHEYYTGLTFEIDLVGRDGTRHVEVGGGGRYDRLLGNFVDSMPGVIIPSMGYAFGLERLQAALVDAGHLDGTAGPLLYARNLSLRGIATEQFADWRSESETADSYLSTVERLRTRRLQEPVSVTFN